MSLDIRKAAILIHRFCATTILETSSRRVVAAVATLWERKNAYNLFAHTILFLWCRNRDWSWSWDWLRFWSTNIQFIDGKSAVLIG